MARNTESNQQQRVNSIVEGTRIVGEISSPGNFRIDGTVEGTLRIEGRLIIGAKGQVLGKVICKDADIEGQFKGELKVNGLLNLKAQASIEGEASFQRLTVEDGAKLKCTCNLSAEKTQKESTAPKIESTRMNPEARRSQATAI
jgi:cytoskeletal protein CcmA (bactofilin family)